MIELYSDKWTNKNGDYPSGLWLEVIGSLDPSQIKLAIEKCKERILASNSWPPELAEFIAMAHGGSSNELGAFFRCINKNPDGWIEKHIAGVIGFNVRSMAQDKAEAYYKKFYRMTMDDVSSGKLRPPIMAHESLPVNSSVSITDIARENFRRSGGDHVFKSRIEKLRKANG